MNFCLTQQKDVKVMWLCSEEQETCIVMEYKEVRKSYLALVLFFPGRDYEILFKWLVEKNFYVFEMWFFTITNDEIKLLRGGDRKSVV